MSWLLVLPIALCLAAIGVVGLTVYLYLIEGAPIALPVNPASRPGIWLMSHRADSRRRFPYQHLFFRITPRDPVWKQKHPELFDHTDSEGLAFATLGAGPVNGLLTAGFNRPWDHEIAVRFEAQVGPPWLEAENRAITALLAAVQRYPNHLRFSAWRPANGPGYNCNALMVAFAAQAGIPPPDFALRFMLCTGAMRRLPDDALRAK